jgi:hypothetical protein
MIEIDLEAIEEMRRGRRFDRLTALLIGAVALLAALLVVQEGAESLRQARAQAQSRRLAAELTTRSVVSGTVFDYGLVNAQRAALVSIEGLARSQAGILGDDPLDVSGGEAITSAGGRLGSLGAEMGAAPGPETPLDPYAAYAIRSSNLALSLIVAAQRAIADSADVAGANGSEAVLGLSVVALAGVFGGLAAVVGSSRTGRSLLALAWVCAACALVLLVMATDIVL